jgi:enamine deaminase RidA (YjgF/YER057c/UK114 family)
MVIARYLAMLAALTLFAAPGHAQDGGIKIEKFTHSEWTRGIFSEAVTVTGIGNAKFVYLAGVGAEDENGPRGNVRHHGNFLEQCRYAYDKVKRVLAHHGASLRDAVKVTTYITDLRHRLTLGQCVKDTWGDVALRRAQDLCEDGGERDKEAAILLPAMWDTNLFEHLGRGG